MNMRSRITHGVYGGLAGGAVFGTMMGVTGMLPMIGNMAGTPSPIAGFVVHMAISAGIGAAFGIGLDVTGLRASAGLGLAYGLVWWVLGPLTLMPLFMGMGLGVNWTVGAMSQALPSLVGHLVFGTVLGVVARRLETPRTHRLTRSRSATA